MRQHDVGLEVFIHLARYKQCQTVVIAVGVLSRHLVLELDFVTTV
jgi:hypothetical protein